ncbi:hypothetical protein [uncultured Treponema sp.]|uniref:hypothetical protein n=1 Tax=uncultured Treponema sp. TaxID=162155 RepID=UPI002596ACB2|nr:hypothetical protein [uncultured Treponema sp.]
MNTHLCGIVIESIIPLIVLGARLFILLSTRMLSFVFGRMAEMMIFLSLRIFMILQISSSKS